MHALAENRCKAIEIVSERPQDFIRFTHQIISLVGDILGELENI